MQYPINGNLAGVVILYNEDPHKIIENILSYSTKLDKIYLYDNSTVKNIDWEIHLNKLGNKVEYVFFGENLGIAKRLNTAALSAIKDGYSFLLTMDQDSSFSDTSFAKYLENISQCTISNVGQFGINFQPKFTKVEDLVKEVDILITSGSIICLDHFKLIGKFNENLFIDFVDIDFSFRVNDAGFKNIQFMNVLLNHQIGELIWGRSLKNLKLTRRIIHSPIRVYYIVRNGLFLFFRSSYLNKKYKIEVIRRMKILKNNYLYHPNLSKVYIYTLVGVIDFLRNKMGKKA